jgi:invasion protein IalB
MIKWRPTLLALLALCAQQTVHAQETAQPSDVQRLTRSFGPWVSVCVERISNGEKKCSAEQKIVQNGLPDATWGIQVNKDGSREIYADLAALLAGSFVMIGLDNRPPVLLRNVLCNDLGCHASVLLDDASSSALATSRVAHLQAIYASGRGVVMTVPLTGQTEAVTDAAQKMGTTVSLPPLPAPVASQIKQKKPKK